MSQSEQEQVTRLKTLLNSPSRLDEITPGQFVREGIAEDLLYNAARQRLADKGYMGGSTAAVATIVETSPTRVVYFDGKRFMNLQTKATETVSNVEQQAIDQALSAAPAFPNPKDRGKFRMKVLTTYLNARRKLWPEDALTDPTDLSVRFCQPGEAMRARDLTIKAIVAALAGNPVRPQEGSSRWWRTAVALDWARKIPASEAIKQGLHPS